MRIPEITYEPAEAENGMKMSLVTCPWNRNVITTRDPMVPRELRIFIMERNLPRVVVSV